MAKPQPRQPYTKQQYSLNPEPVRLSLLAPIFAVAILFVPLPQWIIEDWYSQDMYPWLQNIFTTGTNFLPIALLDVLLVVIGLFTLFRIQRLFHVARQRGVIDAVWEGVRRLARFAGLAVILFFWAWGFNYGRQPLEAALPEKTLTRATFEQMQGAAIEANSLAARLRPYVQASTPSYKEIAAKLKDPLNTALKKINRPTLLREGQPKHSFILPPVLASVGMTGLVSPYGLEAIVDQNALPLERPFALAREWAHLAGYANDAEADAIAWLACMHGSNELAYSASLFVIQEASAALPDEMRSALSLRLDPGVRSDVEAIARRLHRTAAVVERSAERATDEYLRADAPGDNSRKARRTLALIQLPSMRDALAKYEVTKAK